MRSMVFRMGAFSMSCRDLRIRDIACWRIQCVFDALVDTYCTPRLEVDMNDEVVLCHELKL